MLNEQKQLLADVRSAEKAALKLYNAGVKISGIVQKLRATGAELEERIRYIEKHTPAAPQVEKKVPSAPKAVRAGDIPKPEKPVPTES